jgi:hypothetical protein
MALNALHDVGLTVPVHVGRRRRHERVVEVGVVGTGQLTHHAVPVERDPGPLIPDLGVRGMILGQRVPAVGGLEEAGRARLAVVADELHRAPAALFEVLRAHRAAEVHPRDLRQGIAAGVAPLDVPEARARRAAAPQPVRVVARVVAGIVEHLDAVDQDRNEDAIVAGDLRDAPELGLAHGGVLGRQEGHRRCGTACFRHRLLLHGAGRRSGGLELGAQPCSGPGGQRAAGR